MAKPTSLASNNSANSNMPPLPQQDWEVLSMSTMSASTLGLHPPKPITLADEHQKDEGFGSGDMATAGFDSSEGAGRNFGIEPFTEGWRHGSDSELPQESNPEPEKEAHKEDLDEGMQPLIEHDDGAQVSADRSEQVTGGNENHAGSSKTKSVKVSWWRCQTVVWHPKSQKYSAMWSFALVAAVVGIVVIGHRWHRERSLNQHLRLELSSKEEKLNELMYQMNRMKEAVTGRRKIGITRSAFF